MSKHRADAPSVQSVINEVLSQMSNGEIVKAALALTVGDAAYDRDLKVAGRQVRLRNRGTFDDPTGRFGGGWMTQVGIQMGRAGTKGTIIVNLGHGSIRIDPRKRA